MKDVLKMDLDKKEKQLDREFQKKIVERKKKFLEELKTENEVFDQRTLLNIYNLLVAKHIDEISGVVNSGKEAVVFSANKEDELYALKVYRVSTCDFKTMWKYIQGDPRFHLRRSSTRQIITAWVEKEFRNLLRAGDYINTPEPLLKRENILLMDMVHEDGVPAPRLKDVEVDYSEFYEMIREDMKVLYNDAQLVHGDLSEYNILVHEDEPVYIDFSQGVVKEHPLSKTLLIRDVKNVCSFFKRKGIDTDYKEFYKFVSGEELALIDEEMAKTY
uniref:non-specific serine/threonine protein kinase n=1 Tax=Methanococcus maripaludis (strain C6 / ATCC BAA-1332) TaxID=444158 RepID=A9A6C1_METM6